MAKIREVCFFFLRLPKKADASRGPLVDDAVYCLVQDLQKVSDVKGRLKGWKLGREEFHSWMFPKIGSTSKWIIYNGKPY